MEVADAVRDAEQKLGHIAVTRRQIARFKQFHRIPRAAVPFAGTEETRKGRMRVLGKNKNVMKFRGSDRSGRALTFMRFGEVSLLQDALRDAGIEEQYSLLQEGKGEVTADIVYYPEINEWNDTRSLQFIIKDWKFRR